MVLWPLQILRFVAALIVVYIHVVQLAFQTSGSNGTFPPEFQIVGQAGNAMTSRDLLATFFLWPATDVMTLPQLAVTWTLCYEALFYAAATFVLAGRRWLFPLLGLFAVSMALRQHGAVFQFLGNPLIIEFLFGVAIARAPIFQQARWGIPLGAAILMAAGFFNLAPMGDAAQYLRGEGAFQRVFVYGLPSALIVWGAMQFKGRESFWTRQGDASYSLYLTHPLFLPVFFLLWKVIPLPTDLIILISMAAAAFFGWRIHRQLKCRCSMPLGADKS